MRLVKKKLNKRGATLVELLVSFALLALFMTSAIAIITPATGIFQRVKALSYAQSIGDMIMDRVGGELCQATAKVVISDSGAQSVSFTDSHSSPVMVYYGGADGSDGLLHMWYREVRVAEGEGNVGDENVWDSVDWTYDDNAYHGFRIDSMTFTKGGGNAITISLSLKNERLNFSYNTQKTVECYNISDEITEGTVYPGTDAGDDQYYAALTTP